MAIYPNYKYNVSLNAKPSYETANSVNPKPSYENTNYTPPIQNEQNMQDTGCNYSVNDMNSNTQMPMGTGMGMNANMNMSAEMGMGNMGSMPMGNMPSMTDMSVMPGMSNMTSMSNMANMPNDPHMTDMKRDMGNSYYPVCNDLSQRLIKALIGERDARLYYQQLMNMTQSQEDRNVILTIAEDEKKHYDNFNKLYMQLNKKQPVLPQPVMPRIPSYIEGLKNAIFDETDAYEFYRNTYMCTDNQTAKEVFFEAFTDENEHAIRLNYLYAKNK